MLGQNVIPYQQVNQFYVEKVQIRRAEIQKTVVLIAELVHDILKGVETLEPRFVANFAQNNGRYEGVIF